MPRNNGIATLPPVTWATPGTTIRTEQHNDPMRDIEQMLTNSLPRDGSAPMTGDLNMNGRRVRNIPEAVDPGDVPRFDQVLGKSPFMVSLAAMEPRANHVIVARGPATADQSPLSPAFGRDIIACDFPAEGRATLGLKGAATQDVINAGSFTSPSTTAPASDNRIKQWVENRTFGYFGTRRSWDIPSQRTYDVIYTNDLGWPIEVIISASGGGYVRTKLASQSGFGVILHQFQPDLPGGVEIRSSVTFTVPPGHQYWVTSQGGIPVIYAWTELS